MRYKIKITHNNPKNESGPTQVIMMGESICRIWVNVRMNSVVIVASAHGQDSIESVHEKTNNLGLRPGLTQTRLYSQRIKLHS